MLPLRWVCVFKDWRAVVQGLAPFQFVQALMMFFLAELMKESIVSCWFLVSSLKASTELWLFLTFIAGGR